MEEKFCQLLEKQFRQYGFPLTSEQIDQLTIYRTELQKWNQHINLTAIDDDADVVYKHFLDSVSVLDHCDLKAGQTVIDVGTGAGFPGMVLKVYIPDIQLTLIEASHKKVSFLKYLVSQLGFDSSVQVIAKRAETCADEIDFMDAYDWVLTRYVASLKKSAKYCLPMLKQTGRWIAYKSREIDSEINQCKNTLQAFRANIECVHNCKITELNRTYIVIRFTDIGSLG